MDIPNFNEMAQPTMGQPVDMPTGPNMGQPVDMPNGTNLSQEEMKANLQGLMSKIQSKMSEIGGIDLAVDSKIKQANGESLRMIFDILRQNGVDPSDIESVGKFLEKIRTNDPEAASKLEEILGSLIGEEPTDNMNIINNDTAQQEI